MAYDPQTVLSRYQQMLDVPDGEPEGTHCELMQRRARRAGTANEQSSDVEDDAQLEEVIHDTLACEPGGCRSCCVGVVEVVRQFAEKQAAIETRAIEFDDITTRAAKLDDPSVRRAQ